MWLLCSFTLYSCQELLRLSSVHLGVGIWVIPFRMCTNGADRSFWVGSFWNNLNSTMATQDGHRGTSFEGKWCFTSCCCVFLFDISGAKIVSSEAVLALFGLIVEARVLVSSGSYVRIYHSLFQLSRDPSNILRTWFNCSLIYCTGGQRCTVFIMSTATIGSLFLSLL